MGKLVVSLDGVVIKEVQLTKDKTTLGRRPYNDIVIDNLAVSGEHAVLQMVGSDVFIEDLNSTNGTYINGKAIKRQQLTPNDAVEIGKYKMRYVLDEPAHYEKTAVMNGDESAFAALSGHISGPAPLSASNGLAGAGSADVPASVRVLSGAAAGRQVKLTKPVTTVGKPGVQVASISRRASGYVFAHVEGPAEPTVNGRALTGGEAVPLKNGDVIELAGTRMEFVQG